MTETIFELIRKEDVILWVGAGLSIYAGYPSAGVLSKKLIETLNNNEKKSINKNASLQELTEEIVRIKGGSRNFLISELRKIYEKQPSSIIHHKTLSKIPHIKTIITTNYDNLFEISYGGKINKIVSDLDIAYSSNKTELFKVHGDFSHLDSIVITKGDYKKLYAGTGYNSHLWNVIKERVGSKAVVFIGYSFEDTNAEILFDSLADALKDHQKQMFLIAPKLSQHKIMYLNRKGITYINLKAEVFIEKLLQNIQENVVHDLEIGNIKADTFNNFFTNFGLLPKLEGKQDNTFKLIGISSKSGMTKGEFKFKIKKDEKQSLELEEFIKGKRFGSLDINLKKLILTVNGIHILPNKIKDYKFKIQSTPKSQGIVDISFEDGFDLHDVQYRVYISTKKGEVIADYKKSRITVNYELEGNPQNMMSFNFEQAQIFENVNEAINIYEFLVRLRKGIKFEVFNKEDQSSLKVEGMTPANISPELEEYLNYYKALREIELGYKVRFRNITSPTQEDINNIENALNFCRGAEVSYSVKGDFVFSGIQAFGSSKKETLETIKGSRQIRIESTNMETVKIHNHPVDLGYRVTDIFNPIVTNADKYLKGEDSDIKIKSGMKKMKVHYTYEKQEV